VILWVALAWASGRADGDAADAARDYPGALAAWQACAADTTSGHDARYCATRAATLAPQAADGFVGWTELEAVRRDYRTLGSDAALARIEVALAAHPDSPAAPAMRVWLANERAHRGDAAAVERIDAELRADPHSSAADRAFVAARVRADHEDTRRRRLALAGGALAAIYTLAALRGPGPLRWRSAAAAAVAIGVVPATFAALYEDGLADGFVRSGFAMAVAVLLAGRAPRWIAIPGTLGGFAAVAWGNGWYPSLGF
jgi:uncharacterized protein YoaH (UPF0181 family)